MGRKKKITICGIDPGIAGGGAVLIDSSTAQVLDIERLYSNASKKFKEECPGDANFTDAIRRAVLITEKVVDFVDRCNPDLIAVESFIDLGSQAKRTNKSGGAFFAKDRWKAPLVIGYFIAELETRNIPTVYLNPRILRDYADEISLLKEQRKKILKKQSEKKTTEYVIVKGDHLLTNDHLVKAWCHADWARRHYDEVKEDLAQAEEKLLQLAHKKNPKV